MAHKLADPDTVHTKGKNTRIGRLSFRYMCVCLRVPQQAYLDNVMSWPPGDELSIDTYPALTPSGEVLC